MSEEKKRREDDDGRTVADMSSLSGSSLSWFGHSPREVKRPGAGFEKTAREAPYFSRRERWFAVLGALRAALLIAFVFIAGIGLVVLLLQFVWNIL